MYLCNPRPFNMEQKNLNDGRIGLLILNTGSPKNLTGHEIRKYLRTFLSDPCVINMPAPFRQMLVYGIIAPFRYRKSKRKYASIWTNQGSPLLLYTQALYHSLEKVTGLAVAMGMRYGHPKTIEGIRQLRERGVKRVIAIPLFPHYAMSSFETTAQHAIREADKLGVRLEVIAPYYKHPAYLDALAASIKQQVQERFHDEMPHLLFSFHGIPMNHVKMYENDPERDYVRQTRESAEATAQRLGLSKEAFSVSYQSRLGPTPWLQPYTVDRLASLPKEGHKKLAVICPSFITDCLETLEEIAKEGREIFLTAGGEAFELIPCLNDETSLWLPLIQAHLKDPSTLFETKNKLG